MSKIYLDTNILIDYLGDRTDDIDALVTFLLNHNFKDVYISALSIHILFYVLKLKPNTEGFRKAKNILEKLTIIPLTETITTRSMNVEFPDFEDCLQYFSAIKHCDYILTRDKKDFDKIKKLSPSNISIVSDFKDIK